MYKKVEPFLAPLDIFENMPGGSKSELTNEELGFICGLVREYRPNKIVEVGVSAGGTSAVVLNCLSQLKLTSNFYSVDLAYTYHYDTSKECGFQIKDALQILGGTQHHQLYLGKTISEVLPEICMDSADKIDMLILDTVHYLPGELLDFVVCLPYLSENAVVILDDLTFSHFGENKEAIATKVLFDTVVADKLTPRIEGYPKMAAFRINLDTRKYSMDLFSALVTPWGYKMAEDEINPYRVLIDKNYGMMEKNMFSQAVYINEESLRKRERIPGEIQALLEICDLDDKQTVIYGAGLRGNALYSFLHDRGKALYGFVVSDDRKSSDFDGNGRRILALSDVKESPEKYSIILAAADEEIKKNLKGMEYQEAPNYIFPFIKDYVRNIL